MRRGPAVKPALVGVIATAVMFFFLTVAFANVSLFKPQLILKAQVSSADTLAPGGDVDVAGVKVGAIKKIEKSDTGALVTMAVDPAKVAVYRDARVVIRPHGVFGPKFAEVNPGTVQAGAFQSGDAIQIDHTAVSVDFEQVLDELDPNTRMGLQTALYELGKGSEGRGEDWGVVIDSLKTITTHLTPALQVVDRRQVELSRFLDNNAIVVETYGNAPIDSLVRENADILAKLDSHRADVANLVVHGNQVLSDLDTITAGSNVTALQQTLQKAPTLLDRFIHFSNDLGFATNSLAPEVIPHSGQTQSDIALAILRSEDAFGECSISDQNGSDTLHATGVRIVPCYGKDGKPYVDPATGHVAHHHVKVLFGLHTDNTVGNGEEEAAVLCGPNSGNAARGSNPAFTCLENPVQMNPPAPFGGPPPAAFSPVGATSAGQGSPLATVPYINILDLLAGN